MLAAVTRTLVLCLTGCLFEQSMWSETSTAFKHLINKETEDTTFNAEDLIKEDFFEAFSR